MVTQQVVAPPARAAIFLVLTVDSGAEDEVRALLADFPGLTRSVSFRGPDEGLNCVIGIGARLWDRIYDVPRPSRLHEFEEISGPRHRAVSTPGDLLVHLRARHMGPCFELARQLIDRFDGWAQVVDEVHGFTYFDERDLLGFVDGTGNPEGAAAEAAVLIGGEDPAYAGSSYVIVQKYLHDLDSWHAISVEEQQRVIGRTKLDNVELPDDIKPSNSHVALNTIVDADGAERDIVRANMPFGEVGAGEFGTYFIGYAADPDVIEQMLRNMFLGKPPGNTDRILDFSTAVTGGLFFVPTTAILEDGPAPSGPVPDGLTPGGSVPGGSEVRPPGGPVAAAAGGSLGIGSLRGQDQASTRQRRVDR